MQFHVKSCIILLAEGRKEAKIKLEDFLSRVDQLLFEKKWSKIRLAKEAGINTNTLHSFWKKHVKLMPRADFVYKIAEALDVSMEYLLTGEEIKPEIKDSDIKQIVNDLELLKKLDPQIVHSFQKQIHAVLLSEIENQASHKKEKHA